MVLLAFSLQSEIEKYGAYVGIASFFGLAILSLLYFAQAREVKRLRDWAGRAPERAAEEEARVAAEAQRRASAPVPVRAPGAVTPAGNGSGTAAGAAAAAGRTPPGAAQPAPA